MTQAPPFRRTAGPRSAQGARRGARPWAASEVQLADRRKDESHTPLPDRHAGDGGSELRAHADLRLRAQPEGALGIVVNKPTDMTLSTLFEQIDVPLDDGELRERPCIFGGPVQIDRGFVLHRPLGNWQSTLADQRRHRPHDVEGRARGGRRAARGRPTCWCRWATRAGPRASSSRRSRRTPGSPSKPTPGVAVRRCPPKTRLPAAMRLLGIDFSRLSDDVGHA